MEPNFGSREEADGCEGKWLRYRQRAMWKITPALFTYLASDLFCIWRAVQWLSSTHFITAWECSFWEGARLTFYLSISKYGAHALPAPIIHHNQSFHGPGSLLRLCDFGTALPGLFKSSALGRWNKEEKKCTIYILSVFVFVESSCKTAVQDSFTLRSDHYCSHSAPKRSKQLGIQATKESI